MYFLPTLGGVEHDATELRPLVAFGGTDMEGVDPGGVLGAAVGDQFDDCVVGCLKVDVFGFGVVDCCDRCVREDGPVGEF